MSKGYTYNNPGNLTPLPNNQQWIGQNGTYMADQTSVSFGSMAYGIAAMMKQIHTNITQHGCDTVYKLYVRWLSTDTISKTDKLAKSKRIATHLGVGVNAPVLDGNPTQLLELAQGITHEEIPETISINDWQAGYNEYLRQIGIMAAPAVENEKPGLWIVFFAIALTTYILAR